MKIRSLPVEDIFLRLDRPSRAVVEAKVLMLQSSIGESGLLNPIVVRPTTRRRSGSIKDVWEVMAGHHRLEAFRAMGRETIPCQILESGDLQAELITIDENLVRADLTAAQEAAAIKRRKEIYEELHPETKPTSEGGVGRGKQTRRQSGDESVVDRFTQATAAATGKSERNIQRSARPGCLKSI